jgi:heat shock protein beta
MNQQLHLFHSHVSQLSFKHLQNLHTLFLSNAPNLATPFSELPLQQLLSSLPATKLGYKIGELEHEYEKWQRERTSECRRAFDDMLGENAFVEFWGRLGKIGGEGVEGGVAADDIGEDEGEGGGGKVDMKALAKTVDLKEMERVLKVRSAFHLTIRSYSYHATFQNDKRYLMFDHVPKQRERWLRVSGIFTYLFVSNA